MSSNGDAGHAHAHFDPEPATSLGPDEPRTPNWIPVVGGIGFLLFGVYFLARHGGEIAKTPASATASATSMAAPPSKPPARAAAAAGTDRPQRQKPALDASARAALNEQIKKRREAAGSGAPRAATGAPTGAPAPGPVLPPGPVQPRNP